MNNTVDMLAADNPISVSDDAKSWPDRRVLGVDVGNSGGCALLDEAGHLLAVESLPTLDTGPSFRPEVSAALFKLIVQRWHPTRAFVELIGPRSTDGPKSAFAFGAARATIEAVLQCCDVPFQRIAPSVWKRIVKIPPGNDMKHLARGIAIRRWPEAAAQFEPVGSHDLAEAGLLALAALQREGAGR